MCIIIIVEFNIGHDPPVFDFALCSQQVISYQETLTALSLSLISTAIRFTKILVMQIYSARKVSISQET